MTLPYYQPVRLVRSLLVLCCCGIRASPDVLLSDEVCSSGSGGGRCGETLPCVKWRQTGQCSPDGSRESQGDKECGEEVPMGVSGFCQCGHGPQMRKIRAVTCEHRPFTCQVQCLQYGRYVCAGGWRQTGNCSADGDRDPSKDKACDATIDGSASGFCECGDGRVIRKPGCKHASRAFTCENECSNEPDLYEELGLDISADDKAIKQAFRKLSLKYHPDKTMNDVALTARFAAIREAYELISDAGKRAIYDSAGLQMALKKPGEVKQGPDTTQQIGVSLDQLYNGAQVHINFQRRVICRGCRDSDSAYCRTCAVQCGNEKEVRQFRHGPMIMQQEVDVPSKEKCMYESTKITLDIERGMSNGDAITFNYMGGHYPKQLPGNYVAKLTEVKHQVFQRLGNNLRVNIDITLKEALLGFQRSLRHLDGRTITFGFDRITDQNAIMRIQGEGMPQRGDPTSTGDLLIKIKIVMPKDEALGDTERKWLTEHFPN